MEVTCFLQWIKDIFVPFQKAVPHLLLLFPFLKRSSAGKSLWWSPCPFWQQIWYLELPQCRRLSRQKGGNLTSFFHPVLIFLQRRAAGVKEIRAEIFSTQQCTTDVAFWKTPQRQVYFKAFLYSRIRVGSE